MDLLSHLCLPPGEKCLILSHVQIWVELLHEIIPILFKLKLNILNNHNLHEATTQQDDVSDKYHSKWQ